MITFAIRVANIITMEQISVQSLLQDLKEEVQIKFKDKIESPKDFLCLSITIQQETGEYISVASIKRLWGYVRYTSKPSRRILDLLARYIGLSGFTDFCNARSGTEVLVSEFIDLPKLDSSNLVCGAQVELGWGPNRYVLLEHIGEGRFVVSEAENSKIRVGDTATIPHFIYGRPLLMERVMRGETCLGNYVAGKERGLILLNLC